MIANHDWRHKPKYSLPERQLERLRGHVATLVGLGFSLSEVAAVAECSRTSVSRLMNGGSVSSAVADAIWQTEPAGGCPNSCVCQTYWR